MSRPRSRMPGILTGRPEFHPAIECITGIISAGANNELARASAPRDQSPIQGFSLLHKSILDVFRAHFRESIIELSRTSRAGVANDFKTGACLCRALGYLPEPHCVLAVLPVEARRVLSEQEFDSEGLLWISNFKSVIDDLAEGFLSRRVSVEAPIGEINTIQHAQLIAASQLCCILVEGERLFILVSVIGIDRV